MTTDVTLTGAINNAQKSQVAGVKLAEDFTQFLTLLTTQLQNQDPMNPMDSSEFTNQLVQFSQVEQAINTNQKLDNLVGMQLASMPTMAMRYVGMDIMYTSADMNFDGATPVNIKYGLEESAASARMNVFDEKGNLVYSKEAPKDAGAHDLTWDGTLTAGGKAEAGTYSVRIDATDANNNLMTVSTAVSGRVRGVETQNGVVFLLVGERAVALGNIINATEAQTVPAPETGETEETEDTAEEEA